MERNNLVAELNITRELQFLFKKFSYSYPEDQEQDNLKFEFWVGWFKFEIWRTIRQKSAAGVRWREQPGGSSASTTTGLHASRPRCALTGTQPRHMHTVGVCRYQNCVDCLFLPNMRNWTSLNLWVQQSSFIGQ